LLAEFEARLSEFVGERLSKDGDSNSPSMNFELEILKPRRPAVVSP
jgi:hypothetical protein